MTTPESKKKNYVGGVIFGLLLGGFLTFLLTGGHLSFDAMTGVFCGLVAGFYVVDKF